MKQLQIKKASTKGFSLIEMMIVIALIAVLLGIALIMYFNANSGGRAYNAQSGLLQLQTAVRTINPSPAYTGINEQILIDSDKAPSNMVSGNTLTNVWGGTVTVGPESINGGTDNAFSVTYGSVPRNECSTIVASVSQNFAEISVEGTTVRDAANPNPSSATVVSACNNTSNTIVFTSA